MEQVESEDGRKYLQCFNPKPPCNLRERFPGSSREALELLSRTLVFNPRKRITVDEMLRHEFFAEVHDAQNVKLHEGGPVFLQFELEPELDEQRLRKYFLLEVKRFHPNLQIPFHLQEL